MTRDEIAQDETNVDAKRDGGRYPMEEVELRHTGLVSYVCSRTIQVRCTIANYIEVK